VDRRLHAENLTEPSFAVFIRSYRKDLEWLRWCLASIERWCSGFAEIVVVVPESSWAWARREGLPAAGARFERCPDVRDDYLGQQVTKLLADTYTDADYVVHVDSDCVFRRPTRPADLIAGDRPLVHHCAAELLGRHRPWQRPTERFLGWPLARDYMRHPPFTFPRWLYAELRELCHARHGVDVERYVLAQPFREFSEFNALAAFAHRFHADRFEWIDVGADGVPDPACVWYWSWGGVTPAIRREIEALT
jgi:hypothetical protein